MYKESGCKKQEIFYRKINSSELFEELIFPDTFSFFLVENIEGVHCINDKMYSIQSFQLHIVFPEQESSWKLTEKGVIHQILVTDTCLKMFDCYLLFSLSYYKKNPVMDLSSETFYKLLHEFQDIHNELTLNKDFWKIIYSRVRIITLMIGREVCNTLLKRKLQIPISLLIRFIILVIENSRKHRTVKYYADELSISSNYLNILSRRFFDKKAITIINNDVLLEIRNSLIITDKPIKEIAYEFNFNNLPSFSSFFKKNVGISPREFMKKYKG